MPLMRDAQFVTDTYVSVNDTDALPASGNVIVPLARIEDAKTHLQKSDARRPVGVVLDRGQRRRRSRCGARHGGGPRRAHRGLRAADLGPTGKRR